MNIIDFNEHVGMGIETAAALLVSKAPAKGDFNGVWIRAKYSTTHPRDIVNEYHWRWTLRSIVYANSPRGKAEGREREQRRIERQATVDDLVANLPIFADPESVVLWVRAMCTAANMVGVKVPAVRIECLFSEYGYVRDMCCGDNFDHDNIHTSSCWLVGQFLATLDDHPPLYTITVLCDQWLKRWTPVEASPSSSQLLHTP